MAKNTELIDFLTALRLFLNDYLGDAPEVEAAEEEVEEAPAKTKAPSRSKKAAPAPEPDEDEDDDDDEDIEEVEDDEDNPRRAELEGMSLVALKKIVAKMGYDKAEVADADKETLVETILEEEAESTDDGAEDAEEADEDDRRAELEGLGLNALKKVAREEYGLTAADYKGLDKDGIVDLILDSDPAEEEDDDDEEVEDIEEAEDDEFEGYDEEELEGMSLKELKEIATEWGITVKAGTKKPGYVEAILEAQDEEEDDDED